jgi:hypothetical protein
MSPDQPNPDLSPDSSGVFQETYHNYLAQIGTINFASRALRLGAREIDHGLEVTFMGEPHLVTPERISTPSGQTPGFSVRLVLLKYILLCPPEVPRTGQWTPYHGFKDSGPLTVFFPSNVEKPLADHFSGRLADFDSASGKWGGKVPQDSLPYDRCLQFTVLPRIPLLVTLNDRDSDFPAQCTLFFRESADQFLDPECLAILGGILSRRLIEAA